MERFWSKTCQIRHFPRPKHTLLENGNAQSVAIFSRTNGNSNKWKFELQFLNIGTKMELHLFASIMYVGSSFANKCRFQSDICFPLKYKLSENVNDTVHSRTNGNSNKWKFLDENH